MLSKSAYIIIAVIIVVVSFGATMFALNYWSGPATQNSTGPVASTSPSAPPASPPAASTPTVPPAAAPTASGAAITQDTTVAELPSEPGIGLNWTGLRGLNVQSINESGPTGQPALRLIATPNDTTHSLNAKLGGLDKNQTYRITVWVKPINGANLELLAYDQPDGNPVNSSQVTYDLAAKTVLSATGAKAQGAEAASGGWVMAWFELTTKDGQFGFLTRPTSGGSDTFKGDGREGVVLGGIQVKPAGG